MKRSRCRRASWRATAATLVVGLTAACGTLVTPAAGRTARTSCVAPGVTADTVKLGLLFPETGISSLLFGPFRAGVDARLGVANAAGGINGRKITYTWQNDASSLTGNLNAAMTLVDADKVFGLIESTTVATGSAGFLAGRGVPVTGTSLEAVWAQHTNMFSYSNFVTPGPSISTWGDFVSAHGGHSAVVLQTPLSATSRSIAGKLKQSLKSAHITIAKTINVNIGVTTDPVALGQRIAATGADVLIGSLGGATFDTVAIAARRAGAKLRVILNPDGYDQSLLHQHGAALAGMYYFVNYAPFELDTPAHRAFLAAMATFSPQVQPATQQIALSGWISTDVFLRGLTAAGACPTRAGFINGLRAVHDYNADGLLPGSVDFTADFGQLNRCYTFVQVSPHGKRFNVVQPSPLCGRRLPATTKTTATKTQH
jgi:branched-chain amino acid transport system substrate-binding protein